eukprot:6228176-Amphidinium_carterae.1
MTGVKGHDMVCVCGSILHLCGLVKLQLVEQCLVNRPGDGLLEGWHHRIYEGQGNFKALWMRIWTKLEDAWHHAWVTEPLSAGTVRRFIAGGIMTSDGFSRHSRRGMRYHCEHCAVPASTYHVLWEWERKCFAKLRAITVQHLLERATPCALRSSLRPMRR